jgi:hypothetical protein
MDVHKYSTQTERLGIVETGRRRRWSKDEKLRIVLESLETDPEERDDRDGHQKQRCRFIANFVRRVLWRIFVLHDEAIFPPRIMVKDRRRAWAGSTGVEMSIASWTKTAACARQAIAGSSSNTGMESPVVEKLAARGHPIPWPEPAPGTAYSTTGHALGLQTFLQRSMRAA